MRAHHKGRPRAGFLCAFIELVCYPSLQLMEAGEAGRWEGHRGDGEKADMGRKVNCVRRNLLLVFMGEIKSLRYFLHL